MLATPRPQLEQQQMRAVAAAAADATATPAAAAANERSPLIGDKKAQAGGGAERGGDGGGCAELLQLDDDDDACLGCGGLRSFLQKLRDAFGLQHLVLLFVVQHLFKGFVTDYSRSADPYLFAIYEVPAPQLQMLITVSYIPWGMKPVFGFLSDLLPIFGYHRAPYFLLMSFLGSAAYLTLGAAPQDLLTPDIIVGCLFVTTAQLSCCDLLTQATYAEKIQASPGHGPDLLSFVWFGMGAFGLLGMLASGPIIELFGPQAVYLISAAPAALVIIPVVLGFLEEKRVTDEELAKVRARFFQQKEVCFLGVVMLVLPISLTVFGLVLDDPTTLAIISIFLAVVLLVCFSVVLSPTIAKFTAFGIIQGSMSISITGASFYFYTNGPDQYPEGPHFSPYFYNTVMGSAGAVFSLVGIWCYNRYMRTWSYRYTFMVSNLAFSAVSLTDAILFSRLNVRLGIPDKVFVLGCATMQTIIEQWTFMPQVVAYSYLCPEGMEATMYALLASCSNLGAAISFNLGAALLQQLDIRPSGQLNESNQFESLWLASVAGAVLPAIPVVLVFWLVPDAKQTERLLDDDARADPMAGSLWRRWTGDVHSGKEVA